jgi:hypothetical protein
MGTKTRQRVNLSLGSSEQKRVRELSQYLRTKGYRPSDAEIIKATIMLVRPNKFVYLHPEVFESAFQLVSRHPSLRYVPKKRTRKTNVIAFPRQYWNL